EVEHEESGARCGQNRRNRHNENIVHEPGHHGKRDKSDRRYTGSQAVEAVNQVDGVRDSDDPKDGQRNAEVAEVDRPPEWEIDEVDVKSAVEDDNSCSK